VGIVFADFASAALHVLHAHLLVRAVQKLFLVRQGGAAVSGPPVSTFWRFALHYVRIAMTVSSKHLVQPAKRKVCAFWIWGEPRCLCRAVPARWSCAELRVAASRQRL